MSGRLPSQPVHIVILQDDIISWKNCSDESADQVKIGQLLFILDSSLSSSSSLQQQQQDQHNGGSYLICALREEILDDKQNSSSSSNSTPEDPFCLLLLRVSAGSQVPEQLLQRYRIGGLPEHLRHDAVDVVVSTKSGLGLALKFWQAVLQPLWALAAGQGLQTPNVVVTQDEQSVRDFARRLWRASADGVGASRTVVLLSGDGGVVDILNGALSDAAVAAAPQRRRQRQQVLLGLLPLGTGNALFHSLHKPVSAEADGDASSPLVLGLRTLFRGEAADLPVFRASFSPGSRVVKYVPPTTAAAGEMQETEAPSHLYGAVVASYGFHASIVYESDTPEYRVHGDKRFGMVAQELLRESHPYLAHVEIRRPASSSSPSSPSFSSASPSKTFEPLNGDTHAYVLVTLLSNLERTFTISPASAPLDGKLRLVHFGPVGGERTMDVMRKAYEGGKHVGVKWEDGHEVRYEEVDEVRVTILDDDERWRKVCIDGTIVEIPKGGQLSVSNEERGAFGVLVDPRVLPRR